MNCFLLRILSAAPYQFAALFDVVKASLKVMRCPVIVIICGRCASDVECLKIVSLRAWLSIALRAFRFFASGGTSAALML